MKKIILLITVYFMVCTINSCKKTDSHQPDVIPGVSPVKQESAFLKKIKATVKNTLLTLAQNDVRGEDPRNEENEFDSEGINHNIALDWIRTHQAYEEDPEVIVGLANEYASTHSMDGVGNYEDFMDHFGIASDAIWVDNSLNLDFYIDLRLVFPDEEVAVLSYYHETMYAESDPNNRIIISKAIEKDIVNDTETFDSEAKQRLLTTFSLFRYSAAYWAEVPGSTGKENFWDDLYYNACVYYGWGDCPGSCYLPSCAFSALMGF